MEEVQLSGISLSDGDTLWLESGKVYKGTICLTNQKNITIAGKGPCPAVIDAGNEHGIFIRDCQNIRICGLDVRGIGWRKSKKSGIRILKTEKIDIDGIEISGFREGIVLQNGCTDAEIKGCYIHDGGRVGIGIGGDGEGINKRIHITHCKTYDCAGDPMLYRSHSGSGIVLGRTQDALVEYCEAAGNGWAQRQRYANGPVGMWCWGRCERIVFSHCISRDNRTQPGAVDGGGFDFDGSVCDCLMEYNYSYHNEGAGYLLCEYGSGEKWDHNIVRHCVSIDDACRVPQYGAVHYCGHIGRKIDRGIVEKSLLVPAAGRFAVSNDFMAEESKGNAVNSCVMITDSVGAIESDNPVVSFKDNEQWKEPQLHADILKKAPRITDPRLLNELPVFRMLEENRYAELQKSKSAESLFGKQVRTEEKKAEKSLMILELGGHDLEGCNYKGAVRLTYDSVGACMAGEFSEDAFLDFPVSWEDKDVPYTIRAYARTKSPDVRAYLYVTDDTRQEARSYFAGSCAEYHRTEINYTGGDDAGRRIGIRVEKGCLLVQKIEIVENDTVSDDSEWRSLMNPEEWHYFGDVELEKEGSFLIHNASVQSREIQIKAAARLQCVVQGSGVIQFGEKQIRIAEKHETPVTIFHDKPGKFTELRVSRIGEEEGELRIKDIYLEILTKEDKES